MSRTSSFDNAAQVSSSAAHVSLTDADCENKLCKQLISNAGDSSCNPEEAKAAACIAKTLSRLYFAMFHISLEDGKYICFQEDRDDLLSIIPERGNVTDALEKYLSAFVEPNSLFGMRKFCDISTLVMRLSDVDMITHDYRRKGLGWARAQFLVAARGNNNSPTQVIFVVSDIETEKKLQENEAKAIFLAEHDSLTGALNRKAFEGMCASGMYDGVRVGLAFVDVDEFKGVNDELGHGIGDGVLVKVAEVLKATLRPSDKVFRIGGDEFAILLNDCDESAWKALCDKVERMHTALSLTLPADKGVTLSVGVCFSPSGVADWMYKIADSALYHTKRTGRAGCTLMDRAGNVVRSWKDNNASVEPFAVLAGNNAGVGRIEIPKDPSIQPRLYCGDVMNEIYSLPEDITPEERFVYWISGIDPSYRSILREARLQMKAGEDVECTFMWSNDGERPFAIRAVGVGRDDGATEIYYGYHRSLKGALILEKRDSNQQTNSETDQGFKPKTADLMRLHYEAAETVLDSTIKAIGLVDKASGRTRAWTSRTDYSHDEIIDYASVVKRGSLHVSGSKRDGFLSALDLGHVVATVEANGEYEFSTELEINGEQHYLKYHFAPYEADDNFLFEVVEDATSAVETQQNLEKVTESLNAALRASNQIGYEYDPVSHVATRLTDESVLGLPERLEDCPNCLHNANLLHPQDEHLFFEATQKIDEGALSAHCDVRMNTGGEYRWYSCEFNAMWNQMLGRNVATVLIMDVTTRIASMKSFESRIESILYENNNALSVGVFNISKGTVKELRAQRGVFQNVDTEISYDDALKAASEGIRCSADREAYLRDFSCESLLALAESGEARRTMECLYEIEPGRNEWMEISSEVVINPVTADYESIGYTRSVNELHLASILVDESLRGPHNSVAVLLDGGDEWYLYYTPENAKCAHHHDYWKGHEKHMRDICAPGEFERIAPMLERETVLTALSNGFEPRIAFDGIFEGKKIRLENSFTKLEGEADIVLSKIRDITDEEMIEKLRYGSRHDSLTGLYNRETTFAKSKELLETHPNEEFAMMKLNVRRFRMYNAFFGEEAGDEFLRAIADDLREFAKDYEYIAYGRIESDVFCAFFPYDESLFSRHIETIKWRFKTFRDDFLLEPSIGIYVVNDRSLSVEGMFARASTAAKEGGTRLSDVVSRYNDELERNLEEEIQIVNEMESALDQGQFAVYLQPKYNLQTGKHAGAEALVRWINPDQGIVSPSKFIPVFESNGFITSLDHYMWEHVCRLLRKWVDLGGDVKPVSVNISRLSAYSPSTVSFLKELVNKYDIDPALLELELTESAYIDEPEKIRETLRELQSAGFKILMDDFGSGYSSLNTLRDLPVDILKLDMGFLTETHEDDRGLTVISSVMDMTKRLGLPVIAEGVETEDQVNYLRSLGCEYVQGFYFARPMPVADYERLR